MLLYNSWYELKQPDFYARYYNFTGEAHIEQSTEGETLTEDETTTAVQDETQRTEEEPAKDLHGAVQSIPEGDEDEGGKQDDADETQREEGGEEDAINADDGSKFEDVLAHLVSRFTLS